MKPVRLTAFLLFMLLFRVDDGAFAQHSRWPSLFVPDDYPTIQEAITALSDYPRIIVRPGTYVENIDFLGKEVLIRSEKGPDVTVIDGNQSGSVVTFQNGETESSILDGFTLTNGNSAGSGGGIRCVDSSPEIRDCIVIGNTAAENGGGISITGNSTLLLWESFISTNSAGGSGGGLYCEGCSPQITTSRIRQNTAELGGGGIASSGASPVIKGNIIFENESALGIASDYGGGGIFCSHQSNASISNNTISGNAAERGGGIYSNDSTLAVIRNTLTGNDGAEYGGGIAVLSGSAVIHHNTVGGNSTGGTNGMGGGILFSGSADGEVFGNIIMNNSGILGGGMACYESSPVITNNAIFGNDADTHGAGFFCLLCEDLELIGNTISRNISAQTGGGIGCFSSDLSVADTILWDNIAPTGSGLRLAAFTSPSTFFITYSDVEGRLHSVSVEPGSTLSWGSGMIEEDPLFVDPDNRDYHLQQDPCQPGVVNPCVDGGHPWSPLIEGSTRTDGVADAGVVDMGCHYRDIVLNVPAEYAAVQSALDAALDGDTVLVAPGTYVENIVFPGRDIVLKSEQGPSSTVLDGAQSGSVVSISSNESSAAVVEGFTITNGTGSPVKARYSGGGVFIASASPTIRGNIITGSTVDGYGGGLYTSDSLSLVIDNLITGNHAVAEGGGLMCKTGNTMISHNQITDNTVDLEGQAGGIHFDAYARGMIVHNYIAGNVAGSGGGIQCYHGYPVIWGNVITGNMGLQDGGGITCFDCDPPIISNIIAGNTAVSRGGGIHCYRYASPLIYNNTITGNQVTDLDGTGGGIGCTSYCDPVIANTILWGNDASIGVEISLHNDSCDVSVSYSDLEIGPQAVYVESGSTVSWGRGMISADPLFVESAAGDYHLPFDSPCKDAGDNGSVLPDSDLDFEGDPRIPDATIDMGADEVHTHLYQVGSVVPGGAVNVRIIGEPGTPDVILALGTGQLLEPEPTPYGNLYLLLPTLLRIPLGTIPANGVLIDSSLTAPGWWVPGEIRPFQALLGAGSPSAVLTNLMLVEVE